MARRLPIIEMQGKQFFVDERLCELRSVQDPSDRMALPLAMECALLVSRREYLALLQSLRPKTKLWGG